MRRYLMYGGFDLKRSVTSYVDEQTRFSGVLKSAASPSRIEALVGVLGKRSWPVLCALGVGFVLMSHGW